MGVEEVLMAGLFPLKSKYKMMFQTTTTYWLAAQKGSGSSKTIPKLTRRAKSMARRVALSASESCTFFTSFPLLLIAPTFESTGEEGVIKEASVGV
jgi:hypothetical protein